MKTVKPKAKAAVKAPVYKGANKNSKSMTEERSWRAMEKAGDMSTPVNRGRNAAPLKLTKAPKRKK